jgi:hypothetical protein
MWLSLDCVLKFWLLNLSKNALIFEVRSKAMYSVFSISVECVSSLDVL